MHAPRPLLFLAAVSLALAGCGDLLFLEVEQPEICQVLPGQPFSGSEYSRELQIDIQGQLPGIDLSSPQGLESVFRLSRVDFIARTGITDFDFISEADIRILPPEGSNLLPAHVIDYHRNGVETGETLSMTGRQDVDLYAYLTGGNIVVDASLVGTLPPEEWTMDIRVCMYVKIRANYLELGETLVDAGTDTQDDTTP
ncbi:MAG TPA: hypothetical protein VK013_09365 [Myxococcaceae bacterium]|nr:hypothetical protein [Myxococcaceae bacterium]